jgi:hypothetical protein
MEEWFAGLTGLAKAYWAVAIAGTTLTMVMLVMSLVHLDGDGDMDMDGPDGHPSGLGLLSTRAISAFLLGFGWAGIIANNEGASYLVSLLIASTFGVFWLWVILKLMRFLYSLRQDGTVHYDNAVGSTAQVYIPIPAAMEGNGQVTLNVQGRFRVVDAVTRHSDAIKKNLRVRVTEVLDPTTLVVEPDTSEGKEGE